MKMRLIEKFPGVFLFGNKILTKNLVKGQRVYGEGLLNCNGGQYRTWIPNRSKLGAAIRNGLKELPIKEGSKILYLGCAEGTTVSHLSDIVGKAGIIFSLDISERSMRNFLQLCKSRENLVPIIASANKPDEYKEYLAGTSIDLLFQDISQRNQAEIFVKNAQQFLPKGKFGMISIKARSISSTESPAKVFEEEIEKLKGTFEIIQTVKLAPFEKDHWLVYCKKK